MEGRNPQDANPQGAGLIRPIRLGLVGLGKIARDQHLPAIAGNPDFALCATVSPDGAQAGVPAYAGLDGLLAAGPALDAVVLCTPPGVRARLARLALARGLHVMLEKPPAGTLAEAAALIPAAAGRTLFAAWHSREAAAVAAAADWLAPRTIRTITLTWRESIHRWHPGQEWLLSAEGFGVFDPAINAFSILTRILPAPPVFVAGELAVPVNRTAPVAALLTLRSGAAEVRCDLSIVEDGAQRWDIAVQTDAGTLVLSEGGARLAIAGQPVVPDPARTAPGPAAAGEYPRLYRRFAALVAAGESEADLAPLALVEAALTGSAVVAAPAFAFG